VISTFSIRLGAISDNYKENNNTLQLKRELKQLQSDIRRAIKMNREAKRGTVELLDLFEFISDLQSDL